MASKSWYQKVKEDPKKYAAYLAKKRLNAKLRRRNPKNRAKIIIRDYSREDRKLGRSFDLDLNFVNEQISKGCTYCGEKNIAALGLDRVDNTKGHVKSNVVPCCTTCNFVRRDMPVEAFYFVGKALKIAKEKGLLKGWNPMPGNSRKNKNE